MKRAIPYMLAAALITGCGRDEPPKPEAAAPPAPTVAQPSAPVKPAEATRPKAATPARTYTVQRGDTLQAIARKNGVDYRDLAKWNDIKDPGRIRVGQELRLTPPGK